MTIGPAAAQDLASVQALLRESQLPYVDLTEAHMADFQLAPDAGGALKGCIGLERYGAAGLLRSLAVDPSMRGTGVGQVLLNRMLAHAAATSLLQVYLLTTTAEAFFASRGFTPCSRTDAPADMQRSAEFASLCPASASCLFLDLTSS
ncbi:MAG: arsenic resistance N-acetyltransferase ArsN2 [Hydrogenophaga sp.]|uniref:arsenic resistance N-acetyltransferase ArsN2 n=1 Tax=Hydrogenophaga sp. TaxID=1904254 RepID=UPI0040367ADE